MLSNRAKEGSATVRIKVPVSKRIYVLCPFFETRPKLLNNAGLVYVAFQLFL